MFNRGVSIALIAILILGFNSTVKYHMELSCLLLLIAGILLFCYKDSLIKGDDN